ncbi:MAG: toll/interleukin-1 receptor domain-containing protein [Vicinamibacterales bacterium]
MANYTTFADLEALSRGIDESAIRKSAAALTPDKNLFLSHSSADRKWLPGVMSLLSKHGARVYVDKEDGRLPTTPSPETARLLRVAVRSCRTFVLFVSKNTKDSVWIPWELGLSDGSRGESNVALLPVADTSSDQRWAEQEYLGLYQRIVWGKLRSSPDDQWFVHDHRDNTGIPLRDWICRGG